MLIILLVFGFLKVRSRVTRFCTFATVTAFVASCGSTLSIGSVSIVWLPWALVDDLPVARFAIPARFVVFGWLSLAVLVAVVLSRLQPRPTVAVAAAIFVSLMPSFAAGEWVSPTPERHVFSSGRWKSFLAERDNVLISPVTSGSMYWQAQANFGFRIASGYVSPTPPRFVTDSKLARAMYAGAPLPADAAAELRRDLRDRHIDVVISADKPDSAFNAAASAVLGDGRRVDDILVWRVHAHAG